MKGKIHAEVVIFIIEIEEVTLNTEWYNWLFPIDYQGNPFNFTSLGITLSAYLR